MVAAYDDDGVREGERVVTYEEIVKMERVTMVEIVAMSE